MHPDVNAFISPAFYGGLPGDVSERPRGGSSTATTGPVGLGGPLAARRRTRAMARARARRRRSSRTPWTGSIGMTWQDTDGDTSAVHDRRDVIVVAPYNAQVAEIQAPSSVASVAAATSAPSTSSRARKASSRSTRWPARSREDAPRDMDFLYSPQPPQRRDLAGPERRAARRLARRSSKRAAGRPSRCGWSTPCAGSSRSPLHRPARAPTPAGCDLA